LRWINGSEAGWPNMLTLQPTLEIPSDYASLPSFFLLSRCEPIPFSSSENIKLTHPDFWLEVDDHPTQWMARADGQVSMQTYSSTSSSSSLAGYQV
jgi:hypothetical protein